MYIQISERGAVIQGLIEIVQVQCKLRAEPSSLIIEKVPAYAKIDPPFFAIS